MSELLPCPFCGGDAEFERMGDRRQSCIVACTDCGCRHESSDEHENNGASWNSRHTPDGWQCVPVEPSPEMKKAGYWSGSGDVSVNEEWARCEVWKRMLNTAPKP